MIGEDAMPQDIGQHPLGAVGSDVGEPFVKILFLLPAKLLHMIEKKPREKPDADAEFKNEKLLGQRPSLLSVTQRSDKHFRRMARQRAVIVNDEWDG